jgi:prepilin signal peptidase PulO-like enzyme (type II secretory pathway)
MSGAILGGYLGLEGLWQQRPIKFGLAMTFAGVCMILTMWAMVMALK